MKKPQLQTLVIFCFLMLAIVKTTCAGPHISGRGWKAGVANIVITPKQPLWLAGYANRDHVSEGKLTDLYAKALVLEDETGKQAVLITADLLSIPKAASDTIRKHLATRFHLSKSQIIINASHTHTGPVLANALVDIYPFDESQQKKIVEYTSTLCNKIVNMVGKALHSMQEVDIYAGNGVTRFQVNRRNNIEAALTSQIELKGPNDYAVPVIKLVNKRGKLIAIAFGYACHNTVLSGYQFSGDYAGYAQLALEKTYSGATALFFQGCGANQNPLPRRTIQLAKQYGEELAASVKRVIDEDMKLLTPQLQTAYVEIDLPLNVTSKEELLVKAKQPLERYQKAWVLRLLKKMDAGDSLITSYPYPVQVWTLGEQPIFTLGGEVVVEYAIELKRLFGPEIFVLGYSNDVMAYIPTLAILREGGYEGETSQIVYGLPGTWKANIETLIIQQALKLAKEVGLKFPGEKIN